MRTQAAATLLLFALCPTFALAGTIRPWIGAHGSFATYSMSDVNNDIGNTNASLAGTGLSMDGVHGGLGLGLSFGLELTDHFRLGLGYDHLSASTDVGDDTGHINYDFPANTLGLFGQYAFPAPGAFSPYLGGAVGLVSEAGSVSVVITDLGAFKGSLKGSGGLFEVFAGGDWWTAPRFALAGTVGYRHAKIDEIKLAGDILYLANGDKYSIDYSGVFVQAGIKFR
jgi:Outer membrane protein beta-barrel domain